MYERVHWLFSLLLSCPFLFLSVSKRNKSQLSNFSTNESESFLSSFPDTLSFCRVNNQSHLCSAGGSGGSHLRNSILLSCSFSVPLNPIQGFNPQLHINRASSMNCQLGFPSKSVLKFRALWKKGFFSFQYLYISILWTLNFSCHFITHYSVCSHMNLLKMLFSHSEKIMLWCPLFFIILPTCIVSTVVIVI